MSRGTCFKGLAVQGEGGVIVPKQQILDPGYDMFDYSSIMFVFLGSAIRFIESYLMYYSCFLTVIKLTVCGREIVYL